MKHLFDQLIVAMYPMAAALVGLALLLVLGHH